MKSYSYWKDVWDQYKLHPSGVLALIVFFIFVLVGIYAPILSSSQPLVVIYDGKVYFPLLRYLFFLGFYTKRIDLFYNILMFVFPFLVIAFLYKGKKLFFCFCLLQLLLFVGLIYYPLSDPTFDFFLKKERFEKLQKIRGNLSWDFDLKHLNDYGKLEILLKKIRLKNQHLRKAYYLNGEKTLTLFQKKNKQDNHFIQQGGKRASYLLEKKEWIEKEKGKISFILWPLIRDYHWEDDAGGSYALNQKMPWWELTRVNHKDLVASLIFGVRISLIVGILSVAIALLIAIPIGSIAGYYGGKWDIVISRILEVWESMPMFFMLLMTTAVLQSKSIFLMIAVIGVFSWTSFSRYIRAEFFKQKALPYIESCKAMGFHNTYIMFRHILPNAIAPILTILPFAVMGAITSEAGLSFLGLGEEGSCSWGVLMDEGRRAFPGQSYLLWPPALVLTILLISIALIGDTLRDAIDPKLRK